MPAKRSRKKRKNNPLSRFMPWYAVGALALLALGAFADQEWVYSRFVLPPIFLVGGILGLAWTFLAVQVGRISMVSSSTGKIYVYERLKEPKSFFFVVAIYVVFCIGCIFVGAVTLSG